MLGILCSCWAGIFMLKKNADLAQNHLFLLLFQRKSSKAKEKKQKRLEERAAMDAVCAKVEAANKVSAPPASKTGPKRAKSALRRANLAPPFNFWGAICFFPARRPPRSLPGVQKIRPQRVSAPPPGMAKPWWCRRCRGGVNGAFFGLPPSLDVSIECRRGPRLEPATLEWAFELTKSNMQTL